MLKQKRHHKQKRKKHTETKSKKKIKEEAIAKKIKKIKYCKKIKCAYQSCLVCEFYYSRSEKYGNLSKKI